MHLYCSNISHVFRHSHVFHVLIKRISIFLLLFETPVFFFFHLYLAVSFFNCIKTKIKFYLLISSEQNTRQNCVSVSKNVSKYVLRLSK